MIISRVMTMSKDFWGLLKAPLTRTKQWVPASCLLNDPSQNAWDTLSEVISPHAVPWFCLNSSCLS